MMQYNGCSQMLRISLKTENIFIAHPWCLQPVVGLGDYSVHDWRAATSVESAKVAWRECGPWLTLPLERHCGFSSLDAPNPGQIINPLKLSEVYLSCGDIFIMIKASAH